METNDFKKLIDESKRILITAHLNADADAISASLLLSNTLQLGFPDKEVQVSIEEISNGLEFIESYQQIKLQKLADGIENFKPDLLIVLDAGTVARCSRFGEQAKESLKALGVKLAIIDHHDPEGRDEAEFYHNQQSPAVTQDIYAICFEGLGFKKPERYAQIALPGIYFDTGGFVYDNPHYKKTFEIVSQLVDDGASIEKTANQLQQCTTAGLEVLSELINNIDELEGGTYTFISDEFTKQWLDTGKDKSAIKEGFDIFLSQFLRSVDKRPWGFILYPDLMAPKQAYKVSFRALNGTENVLKYAQALGGGGHVPAAGAQVEAPSLDEALKIVKEVIVK